MLAVGNTQDSFHISGLSQIDGNQGANGGGIYCRSYTQDVPCVLSIGEGTAGYPLLTQEDADAFLKPKQDFEGWEIQLNNDNTQVLLTPVIYLIQYENLCGAVNPNPVSYTITAPTIELLPPHGIAGYRFLGWFNAITGGNQIADIPQGSSGNITLYARWEEITEYCTITFCGNDKCPPKACNIPAQITLQGLQEVTLPSAIPQRKFYCFQSWNTDCCGKGISYLPGETISAVNTDLSLYAIWKRNPCGCPCPPLEAAVPNSCESSAATSLSSLSLSH